MYSQVNGASQQSVLGCRDNELSEQSAIAGLLIGQNNGVSKQRAILKTPLLKIREKLA